MGSMQSRYTLTFALLGLLNVTCYAQSPLSTAFLNMKSTDPVVAQKAQDSLALLVEQEMPHIERDAKSLCDALHDSNSSIRLQASAVYVTIVVAAPAHNQVVLSCTSGLIQNAADDKDQPGNNRLFAHQLRNNALFTLAMNPAGPPSDAQLVFETALNASNLRTVEMGAAGLLKMNGGKNESNQQLVENALLAARDAPHRVNLLYAISGSTVLSDRLSRASRRYLSDADQEVQLAAIDAVRSTTTDDQVVRSVMQNVADSSTATPETKKRARRVLNGIAGARDN